MASSASFNDIPTEILLDNLLHYVPVSDLARLARCNKYLSILCNDDALWKHKLQADFNFSGARTARTNGWKLIYKGLSKPRVFVWGERANGRLGRFLPGRGGMTFPVEVKIPSAHIVDLIAGGMSFHALDSTGDVYVWGTLDGTWSALTSQGFSERGKAAHTPLKLALPSPVRSISCGRLHASALDDMSRIWTFVNWGRPFWLSSDILKDPGNAPAQVECGWTWSSVLTKTGEVFVWWPFNGYLKEIVNSKMEEMDQRPQYNAAANHGTIPCATWETTFMPICLPSIPELPELPSTGSEEGGGIVQLIQIAGLDCHLIGLTNRGHVLKFGSLQDEDSTQAGRWEYLPRFSDLRKLKEHTVFSGTAHEPAKVEPPTTMQITHITANFLHFVAYSTGSSSIVLLGETNTTAQSDPEVIPELQSKSVISVVIGDYHSAALTSNGKLMTWGQWSNGALGLGSPETPSSAHHTPRTVNTPTEVRFDHGCKKKKDRFCFSAAAAGWHTGALVIDLDPDDNDGDEDPFENQPQQEPEPRRVTPRRGRFETPGIFRIGLAGSGRGLGGGVGGPAV